MLRLIRGSGGSTPISGDALRQLLTEHEISVHPKDRYFLAKVRIDLNLVLSLDINVRADWEPRPRDVELYVNEPATGTFSYTYTAILE